MAGRTTSILPLSSGIMDRGELCCPPAESITGPCTDNAFHSALQQEAAQSLASLMRCCVRTSSSCPVLSPHGRTTDPCRRINKIPLPSSSWFKLLCRRWSAIRNRPASAVFAEYIPSLG
ncbi:unnamed protein product [Nezara viridula]|uniref:Uncharacterized protein n=1 Tax=Nezara viridula TaxID=85310 RepID=A0A9P0MY25_NEZVI|nr:unnamed protein product [Nezara viridula]